MTIPTDIRKHASLLFVLAACLLLSLLYCPPLDIFQVDKEVFRYAGMLMRKGFTPYRDLFDHKPPLIYFMNYFGDLMGPWGLWLIDTSLATLASILFFRTCRQYRLPFPWLLPLLFNLLIRNYIVCFGIGMTRSYTAVFQLIFFCVLLSNGRSRYFIMGILTALIFFMQQDQILPLLPFLAYTLIQSPAPPVPSGDTDTPATSTSPAPNNPTPILLRSFHMAAGFALITIPILLYFLHDLPIFWKDAFTFNFTQYAQKKPFIDHFRAIKAGLKETSIEMTFLSALSIGGAALLLKSTTNKKLVAAALVSTLLSLSPQYISSKSGYGFYYYFLTLSATLPILVFTALAFAHKNFIKDRKFQALFGLLLCATPLSNFLVRSTHLSPGEKDRVIGNFPEFQYLRQQSFAINHEDDQLYSIGDPQWIYAYNQLGVLAPSRWIYHQFWNWYDSWDTSHNELDGIIADLRRHRTRYIIYDPGFEWRNKSANNSWENFLHENYVPVRPPGSWIQILWQLRQ